MATPVEQPNPFENTPTPPQQPPKNKEKKRVGFSQGDGTPYRDQGEQSQQSSNSGNDGHGGPSHRDHSAEGPDHGELTRALTQLILEKGKGLPVPVPPASPGEGPSSGMVHGQAQAEAEYKAKLEAYAEAQMQMHAHLSTQSPQALAEMQAQLQGQPSPSLPRPPQAEEPVQQFPQLLVEPGSASASPRPSPGPSPHQEGGLVPPAPLYFPVGRQQQHEKSEKAARERADRLAQSVERDYSNPGSRRPSVDGESDDSNGESGEGILSAFRRRRRASTANRNNQDTIIEGDEEPSPQPDPHTTALQLVQSHARGGSKPAFLSSDTTSETPFTYDASLAHGQSGYSTPTNHYDQEVSDYVPPPTRYNGGVLSSLLRLYNNPQVSGSNSVANSEQSTPCGTPAHSRPPSPTPDGAETPKRRSGLFGKKPKAEGDGTQTPKGKGQPWNPWHPHHKHTHSTNSISAGLIGSTSIFSGPASAELSTAVTERVKKERPGLKRSKNSASSIFGVGSPKFKEPGLSKKKRREEEQMRITKHIAQVLSRHRYITALCRSLMMYGAPTHRLEDYLKMSARVLEIEAQFLYIPGCMLVSFDDSSTHTAEVKLVRAPQGVDLGRLSDVHVIYKEVIHDQIGVDEAIQRLNDTTNKKIKYKNWLRIPVYGLASVAVAPFAFQGRFIDLPIAFLLGCIVGTLALIAAPSNAMYSNVFEISAAVITSFLARAFGSIQGGKLFCFSALAQSSIALILPGYMVLCASLELQSQNIVAGSVRMVYAMIYTLFLGYGITIGTAVYGAIDDGAVSTTTCSNPLSRPWYFLFVPMFTLCLCIINQAKIRQIPIMLVISVGGFAVNTYASSYFSSNAQIPNTLGALTIGVMANVYARTLPFFDRHFRRIWKAHFEQRVASWKRGRGRGRKQWETLRTNPSSANGSPGPAKEGDDYFDMNNYRSDPASRAEEGNNITQEQQAAAEAAAEKKAPGSHEVIGYGLAAAAMLPAIFVQVPSGLAVNGSLLSGINAADELTGNSTTSASNNSPVNNVAFTVLLSVIQVAIGITVGLFFSALIVYPLGKRRSALFSF